MRYVTNYPNWGIATDSLKAIRGYEAGIYFAASTFNAAFKHHSELTTQEFDRIAHISAVFLLEMLDKADWWDEYLEWFSFLERNSKFSAFVYERRRKVIERKIARRDAKGSLRGLHHHSRSSLTIQDLRNRLEAVFAHYRFKQQAEAFWRDYWRKHRP